MSPAQQRFGAGFAAGPESLAGFGAQAGRAQLLVDPRRAAAGHSQTATEPDDGVLISQLIDQAKPLGGSCSLHPRGAAEWAGGRGALPPA